MKLHAKDVVVRHGSRKFIPVHGGRRNVRRILADYVETMHKIEAWGSYTILKEKSLGPGVDLIPAHMRNP
jgi:hypothetical protein